MTSTAQAASVEIKASDPAASDPTATKVEDDTPSNVRSFVGYHGDLYTEDTFLLQDSPLKWAGITVYVVVMVPMMIAVIILLALLQ